VITEHDLNSRFSEVKHETLQWVLTLRGKLALVQARNSFFIDLTNCAPVAQLSVLAQSAFDAGFINAHYYLAEHCYHRQLWIEALVAYSAVHPNSNMIAAAKQKCREVAPAAAEIFYGRALNISFNLECIAQLKQALKCALYCKAAIREDLIQRIAIHYIYEGNYHQPWVKVVSEEVLESMQGDVTDELVDQCFIRLDALKLDILKRAHEETVDPDLSKLCELEQTLQALRVQDTAPDTLTQEHRVLIMMHRNSGEGANVVIPPPAASKEPDKTTNTYY
jgi:hypothetical protein